MPLNKKSEIESAAKNQEINCLKILSKQFTAIKKWINKFNQQGLEYLFSTTSKRGQSAVKSFN